MLRTSSSKLKLQNVTREHYSATSPYSLRRLFSTLPKNPSYNDDGYAKKLSKSHMANENTIWNSAAKYLQKQPSPGTLIIVRHGESEWNEKKLFTGWVDVDLTENGILEVEHAARLLLERGYTFDVAYTSLLKRAVRSTWILMNELNQIYRPVIKTWRLNERMYGALEGHSKPGLASALGAELVQGWRDGLLDKPPAMTKDHLYWHAEDRKYLPFKCIPRAESLQDTINRTVPLWNSHILPDLKAGRNVLIVAHRNSIRGILKHIDGISIDEIFHLSIPNGIPLVYKFDQNMQPIVHRKSVKPLRGVWLEKAGLLKTALEREEYLCKTIVGYKPTLTDESKKIYQSSKIFGNSGDIDNEQQHLTTADTKLIKNLTKLEASRKLLNSPKTSDEIDHSVLLRSIDTVEQFHDQSKNWLNIYIDHKILKKNIVENLLKAQKNINHEPDLNDPAFEKGDYSKLNQTFYGFNTSDPTTLTQEQQLHQIPTSLTNTENFTSSSDVLGNPLLIIIRHGKTEHNKLGLFTGWEDAALASEGRKEAKFAGQILKSHDVKFDIVYTSWLSRAIETGLICLNELDTLWVPVTKSWRLNERMYGALTGLSKKMIRQIYGEKQFMKWRRGYDEPPPPISSFSSFYPGNDSRYVEFVQDIPYSLFETCIRSLAHGKLELHRSFPKSESLKDCMERTIPYFKDDILPRSISVGKSVLVASSENAIRGLLMHLCDIPVDRIHSVEIPTGLPLVYDINQKKIRLLQEEKLPGINMSDENFSIYAKSLISKYNFGDSHDLLFKIHSHTLPSGEKVLDYKDAVIKYK